MKKRFVVLVGLLVVAGCVHPGRPTASGEVADAGLAVEDAGASAVAAADAGAPLDAGPEPMPSDAGDPPAGR
jgi:hypothetical protein